jgi:hypothetical protein
LHEAEKYEFNPTKTYLFFPLTGAEKNNGAPSSPTQAPLALEPAQICELVFL